MADNLSSALRELADSAGRPAPTTGAEVRRRAASRRRRRHAALAGGTAVAAASLVLGLTALFGDPDSPRPPAPPAVSPTAPSPIAPSTSAPSATAPSTTAPSASAPAPSTPSATAPATAPDTVAACAVGDLAFSVTSEDGEGKSIRHLLITVTNTGKKKCKVYQYPY
ncbi:DUF4232 domain-containing protein, partial [Streptomyces sp. NPDC091371]|uniref:DUF4232 domain-containing protein n=1 Tax=Streptomyces sp. NPDC091371 TaxID=3155303 RepID=UPI00344962F9